MTTTMDGRPAGSAVDAYLAAVRTALVGVSESERQELLDDLAEHLNELVHDDEADVLDRLGPPEQYAAELLASAGIQPQPMSRSARARVAARAHAATGWFSSARVEKARAFLLELRPGWWVLRGWLVMIALGSLRHDGLWFIPRITFNGLVDVALLGGAILLSVMVGRGPKWASWAATAVGIVALVSVANSANDYLGARSTDGITYAEAFTPSYDGALVSPSGTAIENFFAFDGSGRAINGFYLFDQDGNPIQLGNTDLFVESGVPYVSGLFPQPTITWDDQGRPRARVSKQPRVTIPKLPPVTTAKPTP